MYDAPCLDQNSVMLAPTGRKQAAEHDAEKLELQLKQEDNSSLGPPITAELCPLSVESKDIKLEVFEPDLQVPDKVIPAVKYDDRTKLQYNIKEESVDTIVESFGNNTVEKHHSDLSGCILKKESESYYETEYDDLIKEGFPDYKQEDIISDQRWQECTSRFAYNETSDLLSDETCSSDISDPVPNQHEPLTRNREVFLNRDCLETGDDLRNWTPILKSHSVEEPFVSSDATGGYVLPKQTTEVSKRYYSCTFCNKVFNKKSHLTRHVRIHTGEKPFPCSDCGKRFSDNSVLIAHSRRHSRVKHLPCPQTSGVSKHYFSCTFCNKVFNKKSHLTRHVRIHTGEKPFLCPDCGKRFSDNSVFIAHSRRHSGVKHLPCPHCEMRFSDKSGLNRHITIHLEDEPFSCSFCCKRFNQKCKLTRHILTHTGEKPFACQNCDKKFSDKSNLARHRHTHTGVKSFVCCYCQKKFNQSTHLTAHLRTHTGEKPHICSHCGKGYTDKRALLAHSRKHADTNCSLVPAVTSDSPPTEI